MTHVPLSLKYGAVEGHEQLPSIAVLPFKHVTHAVAEEEQVAHNPEHGKHEPVEFLKNPFSQVTAAA